MSQSGLHEALLISQPWCTGGRIAGTQQGNSAFYVELTRKSVRPSSRSLSSLRHVRKGSQEKVPEHSYLQMCSVALLLKNIPPSNVFAESREAYCF